MTIRDLRRRWPDAEAALKLEREIIITRDSKPVAKLVCISQPEIRRPRWDAAEHARWQKRVAGGKTSRNDLALARSRADRAFAGGRKWGPRDSFTKGLRRHVHKPAKTAGKLLDGYENEPPPKANRLVLSRLLNQRGRRSGGRK